MKIFRLSGKRLHLIAATFLLAAGLTVTLAACAHRSSTEAQVILASTDAQRAAYLESLGWQVDPAPLETLDLQLPEKLEGDWAGYAALQEQQGLPFSDFTGQTVRRYTYSVANYPGDVQGVQINLYLCGEQIIGGDVMALGEDGFAAGLSYPDI